MIQIILFSSSIFLHFQIYSESVSQISRKELGVKTREIRKKMRQRCTCSIFSRSSLHIKSFIHLAFINPPHPFLALIFSAKALCKNVTLVSLYLFPNATNSFLFFLKNKLVSDWKITRFSLYNT